MTEIDLRGSQVERRESKAEFMADCIKIGTN